MRRVIYFGIIYSVFASLITLNACREKDPHWDLQLNTSAIIGFSDTSKFNNRYKLDSVWANLSMNEPSLVYYLESNVKIYVEAHISKVQYGPQGDILFPYYSIIIPKIAERSSIGGIKDYFIEWPLGRIDTLYADYVRVDSDYNGINNCNCMDPVHKLTINNQPYLEETDYTNNGVYVFE